MLHGLEEDWDIWLDVCQLLSGRFRTFCLQLPWNGRNGHYWGQARPAAEWLRQALALAPASPAALVAHSLGANAVLEYLQHIDDTDRVNGRAPSNPRKLHNPPKVPGLQAVVLVSPFYRSHYKEFDWALFNGSTDLFREIMKEGLQVRQGARKVEASVLEAMADKVHEFIGPLGFMEFLSLFVRTPGLKLERIQLPVLVVGGVRDPGSTPDGNAALAQALPQGRLELLAGCGHFSMLTHPQLVGQVLLHFLLERL
jgi:pimeloyl-ACP methyl ester carboxylesterase